MDNQFYSNFINITNFFLCIMQFMIHKYWDSIMINLHLNVQRIRYYKIFLFQLLFSNHIFKYY